MPGTLSHILQLDRGLLDALFYLSVFLAVLILNGSATASALDFLSWVPFFF